MRLLNSVAACGFLLSACSKPAESASPPSAKPANARAVLRVVAIPDAGKDRLRDDQEKIADWIKSELGVEAEIKPTTYAGAVVALVANQADFGWLGGVTTVDAMLKSKGEVMPLVTRAKDLEFKSYIIVKGDSPYQTVADLKGKKFTFGDQKSTSGHVMPRHLLAKEQGVAEAEKFFGVVAYSGNHDKTITDVRDGTYDAGAVNYSTYEKWLKDGKVTKEQVRVLWETPKYVDYSWCVRKDLDQRLGAGTTDKLKKAFLGLDASSELEKTVMGANDNAGGKYVEAVPSWWDGIKGVMQSPALESMFKGS
jgi:phosphonate transport system substrate-binding protein